MWDSLWKDDGPAPLAPAQQAEADRRREIENDAVELLRDAGLEVRLCKMEYPAPGERHADGIEHPALVAVFATPCTLTDWVAGAEMFYGETPPWWASKAVMRPELVAVVLENGETQVYWRRSNPAGEIVELVACAEFE